MEESACKDLKFLSPQVKTTQNEEKCPQKPSAAIEEKVSSAVGENITNEVLSRVNYIQPATTPSNGQKTRHTNRTAYLYTEITQNLNKNEVYCLFVKPVDAALLGVPDYYQKIKDPIDLGSIKKRLENKFYYHAEECVRDIRKMFQNCYLYNGPEFSLNVKIKKFEEEFEKIFKAMPEEEYDVAYIIPKRMKNGSGSRRRGKANYSKIMKNKYRSGNNYPRNNTRFVNYGTNLMRDRNPNVEEASASFQPRVENTASFMEKCRDILNEIFSEKHKEYAWPFYQPDKSVLMGLLDYSRVIDQPIDLSLIKNKLETGVYKNQNDFASDMRLMFTNFYKFHQLSHYALAMGKRLQIEFEMLYANISKTQTELALFSRFASINGNLPQINSVPNNVNNNDTSSTAQNNSIGNKDAARNFGVTSEICKANMKRNNSSQSESFNSTRKTILLEKPLKESRDADKQNLITSSPEENSPQLSGVTYEERRQLTLEFQMISDEQVVKALRLIPKHEQTDDADDSVSFDLGNISVETLKKLKRYVKSCLDSSWKRIKKISKNETSVSCCKRLEENLRAIDKKLSGDKNSTVKTSKSVDHGAKNDIDNEGCATSPSTSTETESDYSSSGSSSA